jgi:hypothetical protein
MSRNAMSSLRSTIRKSVTEAIFAISLFSLRKQAAGAPCPLFDCALTLCAHAGGCSAQCMTSMRSVTLKGDEIRKA